MTSCNNIEKSNDINAGEVRTSGEFKVNSEHLEDVIPNIEGFEELVYVNYDEGYQITFPETWRGWYSVDIPEAGICRVKFVGKSKTGSIASVDYFNGGLPLFYIISQRIYENDSYWDNVTEIGQINGQCFYYATGTGADITALLSIADKHSAIRQTADYPVDAIELDLAARDWDKVNLMHQDINDILATFSGV